MTVPEVPSIWSGTVHSSISATRLAKSRSIGLDMAAHGGEAFGCDIGAAEPLGNGDDAFRHRDPGIDRVIARLDRQPAHLGRAAANVEQQHPRRIGAISGDAPATARRASVSRSITSSSRPVSSATRSTKALPFDAIRHASVAISRKRSTFHQRSLLAQIRKAVIAAWRAR